MGKGSNTYECMTELILIIHTPDNPHPNSAQIHMNLYTFYHKWTPLAHQIQLKHSSEDDIVKYFLYIVYAA